MTVRRLDWQFPALVAAGLALVGLVAGVLSSAPRRPARPVPSTTATPSLTATASKSPGSWVIQKSGTLPFLADVSCADGSHCMAVGSAGTILRTDDGGTNWTVASSGTTHSLEGVSCPSPTVCYAVNNYGEVLRTGDGGLTWSRSVMKNSSLFDISCPTPIDCVTADGSETHDGGTSWQQASQLGAINIDCPTSSVCYAIQEEGTNGVIVSKRGDSWILETVTPRFLNAVTCTSVNTCVAAGGGAWGTNIASTLDGRSWTVQRLTANSQTLIDVGCLTVDSCLVLDGTANVLATTNEGQTWTWQTTGLPGRLYDITCPSSDSCFAVGSASIGGGLIAHYQGSPRP